jgi:hypothetical protein
MTTQDLESAVESLLALPFPPEEVREGDRFSGPSYHRDVLRASRDFWDDRSDEVVEAAEEEIEAAFTALVTALTARWGGPEPVYLEPYLWSEATVPEPIGGLCALATEMLVWPRPDAGRWVALSIGQADAEYPIWLMAAVGEGAHPRAASSDEPG